eukprot:Colp12_sorted_trinity150504_noHs@18039
MSVFKIACRTFAATRPAIATSSATNYVKRTYFGPFKKWFSTEAPTESATPAQPAESATPAPTPGAEPIILPVHVKKIDVSYTSSASTCDRVLEEHFLDYKDPVIGLDIEWKPSYNFNQRESPVALIQLSNSEKCILMHVCYYDRVPKALHQILEDPKILKVGVGVEEDARKLARDFNFKVNGMVDVATVSASLGIMKNGGIKTLAQKVCRYAIEKSKRVSRSSRTLPRGCLATTGVHARS